MQSGRNFASRLVAAVVVLGCWSFASAAVPPMAPDELKSRATHIVTGEVGEVTAKEEPRGADMADRIYTIGLRVAGVEKGEGLKPGQAIEARTWQPARRPRGWVGPQGQDEIPKRGQRVRVYVVQRDGRYELLVPNGWEALKDDKPPAERPGEKPSVKASKKSAEGAGANAGGGEGGTKASPAVILDLPGSGADPAKIDYAKLPKLSGEHAVIVPAAGTADSPSEPPTDPNHLRFQLHNYLVHHRGRFWCIWSDGPPVEDEPTQEVKYATSEDGLTWSEPKTVTGTPAAPYAFIARGLWVRDGRLLALAAHFKGKGAFGADKELELRAYAWDDKARAWRFEEKLYDDAINNFPPQPLPSGDWIVTRRDARFNVSVLVGGRRSLDDWQAFPVVGVREVEGFRPDEPILWPLDDGKTLFALFRDNGGSRRLFHATSADLGKTWSKPVLTNFPNASSKLYSMRTSRGYRVMVLNANPGVARRELYLAVSRDGRTFTRLALLDIPTPPTTDATSSVPMRKRFQSGISSLQYPHVVEHDGHLWIAFSRNKKQTELLRVPLEAVDALLEKQEK